MRGVGRIGRALRSVCVCYQQVVPIARCGSLRLCAFFGLVFLGAGVVMRCAEHGVETLLRCGRCEAPICPKCSVFGAVGAMCGNCAYGGGASGGRGGSLGVGLRAWLVCGVVCAAAGFAVLWAGGFGVFGVFWISVLGGMAAGEAAWRVCGRRQAGFVQRAVAAWGVLGVLFGWALWCVWRGFAPSAEAVSVTLSARPEAVAGLALVVVSAWARVRFRW